jgi:DNA-binding CsgD family transcriptional regulator
MTQTTQTNNVIVPLQSLLIAMSDGVLITDENGRRTYANPSLSDLVGVDPCSPSNDAGAPTWIDISQHDRYVGYLDRARSGELEQEILSLEWTLVTASGRRIPALMKLIPMKRTAGGPVPVLWLIVPDRSPTNGAPLRTQRERDLEDALTRIGAELTKAGVATEPTANHANLDRVELTRLSPRERDVLEHLLDGHRVSTISQRLEVSEHTVRNHLKSMFRKLGVHSQPELIDFVRDGSRN